MRRRAARVDANHTDIIRELRQVGFIVFDTSSLGRGFPDAVAHHPMRIGYVRFLEFKVKGGKLTEPEKVFHTDWAEYVLVVYSAEDVLKEFEMI